MVFKQSKGYRFHSYSSGGYCSQEYLTRQGIFYVPRKIVPFKIIMSYKCKNFHVFMHFLYVFIVFPLQNMTFFTFLVVFKSLWWSVFVKIGNGQKHWTIFAKGSVIDTW